MDTDDRDHFKRIAAQVVPLRGSQKPQGVANSHSDPAPDYCLDRTQMLLSCYRRDEATNPELYCSAVAAVLSEYPRDVIDYVTDPRTGLPSTQKFLPAVAEVREACDQRAMAIRTASEPRRAVLPRKEIPVLPGQITYAEFLLQNTGKMARPVGAFEQGGYLGKR